MGHRMSTHLQINIRITRTPWDTNCTGILKVLVGRAEHNETSSIRMSWKSTPSLQALHAISYWQLKGSPARAPRDSARGLCEPQVDQPFPTYLLTFFLTSPRLKSGAAHSVRELPGEVRRCPMRSGAPG